MYFRTVIARSLSSRLRLLVINQFKQRYRRSLLGMGWMLVGPLLNTAVLSVAFNGLFRSSIALYPVYVMVGLESPGTSSPRLRPSVSTPPEVLPAAACYSGGGVYPLPALPGTSTVAASYLGEYARAAPAPS